MRHLLYTIPFILIYLQAHGQGEGLILGYVFDAVERVPLPGASVSVQGTTLGTVTDTEGTYRISLPPGTYTLRTSYLGYKDAVKKIKLYGSGLEEVDFELEPELIALTEGAVVVGTRSKPRSNVRTAVPVDVITLQGLEKTGRPELSQMINYVAPSFYSTRLTYSDATDHMDPASLRGMNPDQTLLLVHGKRYHSSAVVNVLSVVGKGSVLTDLNSIPLLALEQVEILRDGASAQYGSDAIGGVMNLVLRRDTGRVQISSHLGQYLEGDGLQRNISVNLGFGLGKRGFLNVTADLRKRDATNRAGTYTGLVYRTEDQDGLSYTENLVLDNQIIASRGLSREDFSLKLGNSARTNSSIFFNSGLFLKNAGELYAFGGLNFRRSRSTGDYRLPNDPARNNLHLYPNGFLPRIIALVNDQHITAGIRGKMGGWSTDFSHGFGRNLFLFFVENSANASMEEVSPTSFESGGPRFSQHTTNLDFSRDFGDRAGLPSLNLAMGSEFRVETYEIQKGEETSWINKNMLSYPGAQGFPGFQPKDATRNTRYNLGFYADLRSDLTDYLLLELAGRYENYSDFGDKLSAKAAFRFNPIRFIGLRGSVNTGFRAPALHQQHYSYTGSYYFGGSLFEVLTAPNNSRVADAFGIPPLAAETSTSYNLGLTSNLSRNTMLTVDLYQVDVYDRIILSGSFFRFDPVVDSLLRDLPDVGGAQFFSNAVDTRTRGLDLVFFHQMNLGLSSLGLTFAVNLNETQVREVNSSKEIRENDYEGLFFDRNSRALLESAQPRGKYNITLNYRIYRFNILVRNTRFGEVSYRDPLNESNDQDYAPKWISDARINYRLGDHFQIRFGGNNLLNIYPDKNNEGLQSDGRFPYNTAVTQFGFNGAYFYGGIDIRF